MIISQLSHSDLRFPFCLMAMMPPIQCGPRGLGKMKNSSGWPSARHVTNIPSTLATDTVCMTGPALHGHGLERVTWLSSSSAEGCRASALMFMLELIACPVLLWADRALLREDQQCCPTPIAFEVLQSTHLRLKITERDLAFSLVKCSYFCFHQNYGKIKG